MALFSFFNTFCQNKVDIKIEKPDTYYKERLVNEFIKKNEELFDFSFASTNLVSFDLDISKIFKIEGISTKFSGKGRINLKIENTLLGIDTVLKFSNNISVKNKYEIEEKLLEEFLKNVDGIKLLGKNLNTLLINATSKKCAEIIRIANVELESKNYKDAFRKAKPLLNSDCSNAAQIVIEKIELAYGDEFCNEKLPRIKILANSGIDYKMEIAVDELYFMPLKAKCKDEAINVSKQIGEFFLKKNNGSVKVLNLNQMVLKGNSLDYIFKD